MNEQKTYKYKSRYGKTCELILERTQYTVNGSLAVDAWDIEDGPYGMVTVNIEGGRQLADNEAYLDTNNWPDVGEWLMQNGIAEPTGEYRQSGYCTYPLFRFNLDKIPCIAD